MKARVDLLAAEVDMSRGRPLLEDALFHCQQAVEKSLKGLLTWHDVPFGKSHDLKGLGWACIKLDSSLAETLQPTYALADYAWLYRYPQDVELPAIEDADARAKLVLARAAFEALMARVPPEARSEREQLPESDSSQRS